MASVLWLTKTIREPCRLQNSCKRVLAGGHKAMGAVNSAGSTENSSNGPWGHLRREGVAKPLEATALLPSCRF